MAKVTTVKKTVHATIDPIAEARRYVINAEDDLIKAKKMI